LGDKSKISDFLKTHIPKNPKIWCEPFGGGFGLFFTLDLKDYTDTEFIYNDINPLNCLLFDNLKSEDFYNKMKSIFVTKDIFIESFEKIVVSDRPSKKGKKTLKVQNSEEVALAWLIILCCGDNHDIMSKTYKGNSAFEILKFKLPRYSEYFKRITIKNLDYKQILKDYDDESTFFYLDPPYKGYEKYYINNDFSDKSHLELSEILKSLKSQWILSYYKFSEIEDWYVDYKLISKKTAISEEFLILGNNI
jgi:DNA adenine methylase